MSLKRNLVSISSFLYTSFLLILLTIWAVWAFKPYYEEIEKSIQPATLNGTIEYVN